MVAAAQPAGPRHRLDAMLLSEGASVLCESRRSEQLSANRRELDRRVMIIAMHRDRHRRRDQRESADRCSWGRIARSEK